MFPDNALLLQQRKEYDLMKRLLRHIAFCLALLLPAGVLAADADPVLASMEMQQEIQISLNGTSLRVIGAAGQTLEIYNVTGVRVFCSRIDSADRSFNLNLTRGCYIVRIGKFVRKISIV